MYSMVGASLHFGPADPYFPGDRVLVHPNTQVFDEQGNFRSVMMASPHDPENRGLILIVTGPSHVFPFIEYSHGGELMRAIMAPLHIPYGWGYVRDSDLRAGSLVSRGELVPRPDGG